MPKKNSAAAQRARQFEAQRRMELETDKRNSAFAAVTSLFVAIIWGFLPLFVTNKYYNITETKAFSFWAVAGLFVLTSAIVFFVYRLGAKKTTFNFVAAIKNMGVPEWAAVALLLITFISACFSKYQSVAWLGGTARYDGFVSQAYYIFLFFMIARYYTYRDWHGLFLTCICSVMALVGILQFYGLDVLALYPEGAGYGDFAFLTLIGNVNFVSPYACMMSLFLAFLFIKTEGGRSWAYFGASALAFYLQTLAGSDSGWVCLGCGMLFTIPFVFRDRKSIMKYGAVVAAYGFAGYISYVFDYRQNSGTLNELWLAVALLGALLSAIAYFAGKKIRIKRATAAIISCALIVAVIAGGLVFIELEGAKRESGMVYEARQLLHGNMENDFMSGRGYIWKTAASLVSQSPIIGSGPDCANDLQQAVYGDESVKAIGVYINSSHNEYIQYAVCVGLLGLAAYLALIGSALARWGKKAYLDKQPPHVFAAGASVIGYVFQAVFNFSLPIVAPYYWVFLGMAASRGTERKE